MTHKRHSYPDTHKAKASPPSVPTNEVEPSTNDNQQTESALSPTEKRWLGLTRFERIMSVLTLAGVIVAVFTCLIFIKQLKEMRTDQRPWIGISFNSIQFPQNEAAISETPVVVKVVVDNAGKTPARAVTTKFVMEYVTNGDSPEFSYNKVWSEDTHGMIFPHITHQFSVTFLKQSNGPLQAETRFLTPDEFRNIQKGDAYMVVYAESTYLDIFGSKHWLHNCLYISPNTILFKGDSAKACTDYNDTDSE